MLAWDSLIAGLKELRIKKKYNCNRRKVFLFIGIRNELEYINMAVLFFGSWDSIKSIRAEKKSPHDVRCVRLAGEIECYTYKYLPFSRILFGGLAVEVRISCKFRKPIEMKRLF